MKTNHPTVLWALKYRDGTLCVTNLHWTRRECIKDSESNFQTTWKELKKYGHQAVKVEVTEVL